MDDYKSFFVSVMEGLGNAEQSSVPAAAIRSYDDIDFESSHRIINTFMDSVQSRFSKDMNYKRPLLAPQANIVFALDSDTAGKMMSYMRDTLVNIGGFALEDFSLTVKASLDGVGLQRIRLDFKDGVTRSVLWKICQATERLTD